MELVLKSCKKTSNVVKGHLLVGSWISQGIEKGSAKILEEGKEESKREVVNVGEEV